MNTKIRKSSDTRRKEIVQAIFDIIGTQGMNSLSTQAIADQVGLTTGALFRHFKNKNEMLQAVVLKGIELIGETFPEETLPPLERIFCLAQNRIETLGANPGLAWLLRSEQVYLSFPEDSVNELRQMSKRTKHFMLKSLKEAAKDGSLRQDIKPELMMIPIMGSINSLIGMICNPPKTQSPDVDATLNALEQLIRTPNL